MDSETLETSSLAPSHGEVVMNKSDIIQMVEVDSSTSSTPTAECSENKIIWQINASEEEVLSRKWKKPSETMTVVQHFLNQGMTPKQVLSHLLPQYSIPASMTDEFAIQVLLELFSEKRTREKLSQYNTFEHAVELFRKSKRILVLTGAGVSVSCGIPDFRSKNGIYARLHKDFPELPDPTAMFDIDFFKSNPAPFYNFAKEIFPGQFKPSISHMFIKFLEEEGKLLRNYTQNIDTLEKIAGIERVLECHGSFARSTCLNCKAEIDSVEIKNDVFAQKVAYCKQCKVGVLKPNIVFFGEDLGEQFHHQMGEDHDQVDLLVVVGSSLKVQPVALIPFNIEPAVPQILINREQLSQYQADIKLLGNCDEIVLALCMAIGGGMREKMIKELKSRPEQFPHWQSEDGDNESLLNGEVTSETTVPIPSQSCSGVPKTISISEFRRMVDEPPAKRKCGSADDVEKADVQAGGEEDAEETMWESNYVRVEDALQQNSLLFVPPNLNVFKGAELYYERDAGTFSRQPGPVVSRACCDDDDLLDDEDDDDSRRCSTSSDDNGSSSDEAHSLPANHKFHDTAEDSSEEFIVPPLQRPNSCPMPFLTVEEVEEALAEQRDIRTLLDKEEFNSDGVKNKTVVEIPETAKSIESGPV